MKEKKIYNFENLYNLLNSPIEKVKLPLILAGNNMANLNEKSEYELRQMVFEYVKLDPNDIEKVRTYDKEKLSMLASKTGLSLNELFIKLGVPVEKTTYVVEEEKPDTKIPDMPTVEKITYVVEEEKPDTKIPDMPTGEKKNDKEKEMLQAYRSLIDKNVSLYTNGTLSQYGLSDEQALEIVSNLTGISKDKLQEAKNNRDNAMRDNIASINTNNDPSPIIGM